MTIDKEQCNNLCKEGEKLCSPPLSVQGNLFTGENQSRESAQGEELFDEITKLRRELHDVMRKIGAMKWGDEVR